MPSPRWTRPLAAVAQVAGDCRARAMGWLRVVLLQVLAALALVAFSVQAVDTDRIVKSAQKYGPTGVANAKALQQMMAALAGKDDATRIKAVNDFYNQRLAYMEDIDNWGQVDYWASPLEALGKGAGDCEDYAIGKYFTLTSMGMPHARLRMVYVRASIAGAPNGFVAHMVLAYYPKPDAEPLVLDNLKPEIHPAGERPDLAPVFSFNAEGLWQGVGSIRANGDPMTRLSKWREVVGRARQDGFQ
ncbi:transglutaminase-like cysteine peptidase [Scleromatobacter humisilvae]|uniref:Transglutaminase-like cysteine peptidase n=1 Tax=Scleromatobacter humisilvae TaxID=2897159 RepID=A0A9X1YNT3_9BURK|nr:transglutaminase-like cysteine peptidase [Scleromatobacter humisilvae]MCK9689217.1 transglutaminase-like cysteine peptidase [Scleromatobacter humisilvae]